MKKFLLPLNLQAHAAKKDPPTDPPADPPVDPPADPPKPKGDDTPAWAKQLLDSIQKLVPTQTTPPAGPTTIPAPKAPQRKDEDDPPVPPTEPPAPKKQSFWDWLM